MKKRQSNEDHSERRRKKVKRSKAEPETLISKKGEILSIQSLREGMLLLGCVSEVRSDCVIMSLPGCLVGKVPITNISKKYTEILTEEDDEDETEASIVSMIELGSTFPCKVLRVMDPVEKQHLPTILLTIDPQDVNSKLRLSSLYLKMVLHATVQSVEDHGYVMDLGVKGIQGFLPFSATSRAKDLRPGQVIPTSVRKLPSEKKGNVVWLSKLSFNDTYPEVEDESLKLSSILPGTNVAAYITEITNSYVYLKCMDFDACASAMSFGGLNTNLTEATKVSASVLYIQPVTNMIYLHLGRRPTPSTFSNFFRVKKFDILRNVTFQRAFYNRVLFKINKGTMGYIKKSLLKKKSDVTEESLLTKPVVSQARVILLHYIDNLVELSFNKSFLEKKIIRPEDVEVGNIYECRVKSHSNRGMFVTLSPCLTGYVKHIHFSDSLVTHPEKLHPVRSRVSCRVLSIDSESFVNLTCKESLVSLPPEGVLKSYEGACPGNAYKGVIVHKTDSYFLVMFFNGVRGLVPKTEIPASSVYFVGQTVTCHVIYCTPQKLKLGLSLMGDKFLPKELTHVTQEKTKKLSKLDKKKLVAGDEQIQPKEVQKAVIKSMTGHQSGKVVRMQATELGCSEEGDKFLPQELTQEKAKLLALDGKKFVADEEQIEPEKLQKAVIKSVSGHQLNLLLDGGKVGRIHVTELGCTEEESMPIRNFRPGQKLRVHCVGIHSQRSSNYLDITHRNYTKFSECSLEFPPLNSLDREFCEGMSMMGFIKEVHNGFVVVWLSPRQVGTLDFLLFSKNPKDIRRLKKRLKVGMSLSVTILSLEKNGEEVQIKLTKLEKTTIQAGENTVGLVQMASMDSGVVVRLAEGYRGVVCLTDLNDSYCPLRPELDKCRKLGYILCRILEVNRNSKFCVLSLRKSRLYGVEGPNVQPEVTIKNLTEGQIVKGFVKSLSVDHFTVSIGRMLDGSMAAHSCNVYGCDLCVIFKKYCIGDVIDVRVDSISATKKKTSVLLSLSGVEIETSQSRLNLKKDIDWDEL